MNEEAGDLQKEVKALQARVTEQIEAMNYQAGKKIGERRSAYQKIYWQVVKSQQHLVEGGFGQSLAKHIAEYIAKHTGALESNTFKADFDDEGVHKHVQNAPKLAEFLCDQVAVWDAESVGIAELRAPFKEEEAKSIEAKQVQLEQKCKAEEKLHGTVGSLSFSVDWGTIFSSDQLGGLKGHDLPGSQPWMMGMKRCVKRVGPVAVPSPGIPLLLLPRKDLFVHVMPASKLLAAGIPVSSYESFLSTPEGLESAKEHASTAYLRAGSAMFIPAGYIIFVLFYLPPPKTKKITEVDVATCIVAPVCFEAAIGKADTLLKTAMLAWHNSAAKDKGIEMWLQRKAFLEKALEPPTA